ncbi:hypothetical protein [Catellatospora coxensis]|uniref:Uncharacterized protein n=1 Tax=Catellatospora coxensis TaxID=310354 RepID=A0A8J3P9G3_9ACTN|nr:hypothetical protein [Catellatospora coxensis]GIG08777.1 hypothetical protein Cco03nite_54770 [Catellatospora coxensis]
MNGTDAAPAKEPTAVKEPVAPRHAAPEPEPVEEDAFARFSPDTEEETPTRVRRTLRGTRFVLLHEWALAAYASLALAVAMTWPTLRYPAYTIPQDTGDPTLQAWQMAWSGHVLKTDWSQLWHSNSFYPEKYSFAFSDTLLGYAPAGLFGTGLEAALVRYNVMYVLLHALAFFGAYVLLRQLGSGKTGAAVAGAAFAYAPWRLAQAGHMHVMSVGGIALALAMLARGHGFSLRHGYRPELRKPGWALAGWLVAAWQISLGFGIGLPFAYVLAGIVLVSAITYFVRSRWVWSEPKPFGWKLFTADAVGGLVFAAVGGLIALAYFKVVELHPYAERSDWEVDFYSPPILGFFTSPAQSMPWGEAHSGAREVLGGAAGETSLLPGFVLYGLAFAGLVMSAWTLRKRMLLFSGVVLSVILAMGTKFFGGRPGYMTLYDILPGWSGIRTPGRLVIWTTLLLAILAAGAVTAFVEQAKTVSEDRVPSRPHPLLRLATFLPLLLVVAEGLNVTEHPVVPLQPPSMATAQAPMLVLPSDPLMDMKVMVWSTDRLEPIVNGNSGFTPTTLNEVRELTKTFPDQASVNRLRELGVKTVLVLREEAKGTPYEPALTAPADGLGVQRVDAPDAVVFTLS